MAGCGSSAALLQSDTNVRVRSGAKRTASRGEGLLDPCQFLLDAIQARVNGLRLGEALLEDAVEEALIRDAAVCGQFLQLGQAVGIYVDRDLHAFASVMGDVPAFVAL